MFSPTTRTFASPLLLVALLAALCVTPATAGLIVNLTTLGSAGTLNGALYQQFDSGSTGSGTIHSFVQIQASGNGTVESGYNTTVNNTLDNGSSNTFNHAITLGEVPIVTIDGVDYREFLLDINEASQGKADGNLLSLDEVQIFVGGTANHTVETLDGAGVLEHDGTLIYRMDAGMDNWVALNAQLNSGSGSGDMLLYVPNAVFAGKSSSDPVTLYSEFGKQGVDPSDGQGGNLVGNFGASSGFEEWAVQEVPEPATCLLLVAGCLAGLTVRDPKHAIRS